MFLRLDARAFAGQQRGVHTQVARIGEEVREVPFQREPIAVARISGLEPRRGVIRAPLTLPPSVEEFPESAFQPSVQEVQPPAANVPPELAERATTFTVLDSGWRLHRHPRDRRRAKLTAAPRPVDPASSFTLRLEAFPPMPDRLESQPFDLPAGARIELAYGLSNPVPAVAGATVDYTATLGCAWRWPRVLHHARLPAGSLLPGWRVSATSFGRGARGCRLRLQVERVHAGAGDALWAVPRVLAPAAPEPRGPGANLVLISLDTLRADHVSGYGYFRRTSPEIERLLIERGTTFTDVSTTYPITNVAHLSLFTGLYPAALPSEGILTPHAAVETLAEALHDAGYATRAFTEDGLLSSAYGFAWGFDELTEHHPVPTARGARVFREGGQWLREHRDQTFFLFLHTYKVHAPYKPGAAYRSLFTAPDDLPEAVATVITEGNRRHFDAYDQGIRETDDLVAGFLHKLDRLGLGERTLVVLLSDHGEAFGEHGVMGHGFSPHQEALHVPLVLRGPGVPRGRRIGTPVSLVDVAPTLLDLLGVAPLRRAQGRSLRAGVQGGSISVRPVFFEWMADGARGVRWGPWKLLWRRDGTEVFALPSDPGERAPRRRFPAARLEEPLRVYAEEGASWRRALELSPTPADAVPISPETERSLRALGYIR